MAEDQIYSKVIVDDVEIPRKYQASTMVHFLRLLDYNNFGLQAHEEFGKFMRVTLSYFETLKSNNLFLRKHI